MLLTKIIGYTILTNKGNASYITSVLVGTREVRVILTACYKDAVYAHSLLVQEVISMIKTAGKQQ